MDFQPTHLPIEDEYPKLVRDGIPEIIKEKQGAYPPQRTLNDDNEFLDYLLKKMVEESVELQNSVTIGNLEEELADVFEVIDAILKLKRKTKDDIAVIQKEKRKKRGGFEKRILMLGRK